MQCDLKLQGCKNLGGHILTAAGTVYCLVQTGAEMPFGSSFAVHTIQWKGVCVILQLRRMCNSTTFKLTVIERADFYDYLDEVTSEV